MKPFSGTGGDSCTEPEARRAVPCLRKQGASPQGKGFLHAPDQSRVKEAKQAVQKAEEERERLPGKLSEISAGISGSSGKSESGRKKTSGQCI